MPFFSFNAENILYIYITFDSRKIHDNYMNYMKKEFIKKKSYINEHLAKGLYL